MALFIRALDPRSIFTRVQTIRVGDAPGRPRPHHHRSPKSNRRPTPRRENDGGVLGRDSTQTKARSKQDNRGEKEYLFYKRTTVTIFFYYLNNPEQSLIKRQVVGRNCRVHFYVHISAGVRDGRDATLQLQVQLIIKTTQQP